MKQNLFALIQGQVKNSTKILVGLILGFPVLMQDETVKNFVTKSAAAHPRISSVIAAMTLLSALLHSPTLQATTLVEQK
jgi:hypothetical protein